MKPAVNFRTKPFFGSSTGKPIQWISLGTPHLTNESKENTNGSERKAIGLDLFFMARGISMGGTWVRFCAIMQVTAK